MADEPRWLTDEQQKVWRDWLAATARVQDALTADLRQHNLDLNEYEVLVVLSEQPDRSIRMSDLAAKTNQSRSRLTHTVARLQRDALIERTAAPDDGRGVLAHLTDEGFTLLTDAAPNHVEVVRRVFVDPPDPRDYAAMGKALQAILAVAD